MKYLKYTLGIIAILAIVFLALGVVKPKITYDCDITVEKPIDESWAVTQDEEKMPEWLIGFQKIEHISGTPGTVGAVSDVYFVTNGQEQMIREKITEIIPNESISMTYESDFMDMDYTLSMKPDGESTIINSSTITKGNGMISKSIMALMGGSIKAQEEINLSHLKKTIENNTKIYSAEDDNSLEVYDE